MDPLTFSILAVFMLLVAAVFFIINYIGWKPIFDSNIKTANRPLPPFRIKRYAVYFLVSFILILVLFLPWYNAEIFLHNLTESNDLFFHSIMAIVAIFLLGLGISLIVKPLARRPWWFLDKEIYALTSDPMAGAFAANPTLDIYRSSFRWSGAFIAVGAIVLLFFIVIRIWVILAQTAG